MGGKKNFMEKLYKRIALHKHKTNLYMCKYNNIPNHIASTNLTNSTVRDLHIFLTGDNLLIVPAFALEM